jgi:formiminoglutamase
MDEIVKVYNAEAIQHFIRKREGEEKLGEKLQVCAGDWKKSVVESDARYVILGIPEDIGVRANQGRGGAQTAWKPALESFLNQQHNTFLSGEHFLVLGEIWVEDLMLSAEGKTGKDKKDLNALRELVSILDSRVSEVIKNCIVQGKIPIVIGGGHNNAYGNLKGAALALNQKVNCINCDPHLDFRSLEGRHSGNGFSYAFEDGFLNKYAVLCMHEQYNNRATLEKFKSETKRLYYTSYEEVFVSGKITYSRAIDQCLAYVKEEPFGLEIDLDAIINVPSSAKTSSGLSPLEARQFVHRAAQHKNVVYFHLAEAAPVLSHIKADNKTGKLIAYLISDFVKGHQNPGGN